MRKMIHQITKFTFSCGLLAVLAIGANSSLFGQDLSGVKCIVHGTANATLEATVDYRDAKVYFCCDNCAEKFRAEMDNADSEMLVKANHQLVLTGQFTQKSCPLTGREVASDKMVEVGGAKVGVCCGGCLAKVEGGADLATKAKMVFASAPFEKGFLKKQDEPQLDGVACFMMPAKKVKDTFSADYAGHKVFFCCKGCLGKFNKKSEDFVVKANQQLAQTKQVKQSACPISGSATDAEQTSEVNGVSVAFCCGNCKGKVDAAEGDDQTELVFGKEAFAKAFK